MSWKSFAHEANATKRHNVYTAKSRSDKYCILYIKTIFMQLVIPIFQNAPKLNMIYVSYFVPWENTF